ncbi:MAG TPA: hypothetical protein VK828_10605 [Terriglobales bacterium]|jgi:hypothetical protein|nr:hypothetical protein [Terriglobales bacterium]
MKTHAHVSHLAILVLLFPLHAAASSNAAGSSPCTAPNGSIFNLEPRPNAVTQAALSVAFLPNRAGADLDLVVATATDQRGLSDSPEAFYVQRSTENCAADLEGGLPSISNAMGLFMPLGTPIVVADPAHDGFFIADLRFASSPDLNGVGIIKATSANLLNATNCPTGTQTTGSAGCFTTGSVSNITGVNNFLIEPNLAVDQRTSGTGAGDVYTVVTETLSKNDFGDTSISLTACRNADLNCSNNILISGTDAEAKFGWVQVRPDGVITVSYVNLNSLTPTSEEVKFVTCTPNGAPNAPTCSAPVVVTKEAAALFNKFIGQTRLTDFTMPKHTHRLENNGTVTTFLSYDRCEVKLLKLSRADTSTCPKTDVVVASSTDGGKTWSPIAKVSNSPFQQFFSAIATDTSTDTVNIAYYSTENDVTFQTRPQVFLAQIAPGTTSVGTPHLLTSASIYANTTAAIPTQLEPVGLGDRIGLAAAGTGTAGQSHAYVGFTWNSVFGTYGGVSLPDMNNHLTFLQY